MKNVNHVVGNIIMEDYIPKALRTELKDYSEASRAYDLGNTRLMHAVLGLVTESAELADALKKHIYYGKPLDGVNLKEEIGDLMWYLAILADTLGITFEDAQQLNINKLAKRYHDKFTTEQAINRDIVAERKILEG
jgi:NTP pyrophosphatase (non-canonical NTP hydrolase)